MHFDTRGLPGRGMNRPLPDAGVALTGYHRVGHLRECEHLDVVTGGGLGALR